MDRSAIYCSPLAIFCPHQIHLWSLRAIGRVSDSRLYPLKLSSYRPCLRAALITRFVLRTRGLMFTGLRAGCRTPEANPRLTRITSVRMSKIAFRMLFSEVEMTGILKHGFVLFGRRAGFRPGFAPILILKTRAFGLPVFVKIANDAGCWPTCAKQNAELCGLLARA